MSAGSERRGRLSSPPGDRGAGSALAVAVVAAVVLVTATAVPLYMGFGRSREIAAAADAAALAAADTASGAVAGVPCEAAQALAGIAGARLVSCSVEGAVATVHLEATVVGISVSARARAGPPRQVAAGVAPALHD